MSKVLVGVFALVCLAAPLFAAETAAPMAKDAAPAVETTKAEGDKKTECKHCQKPVAECSGKGKKHKNKKS